MRRHGLRFILVASLCSVGTASVAEDFHPRVGQVYPDFTLPSLAGGSPISLSQFRGRKVLLVHFASW